MHSLLFVTLGTLARMSSEARSAFVQHWLARLTSNAAASAGLIAPHERAVAVLVLAIAQVIEQSLTLLV